MNDDQRIIQFILRDGMVLTTMVHVDRVGGEVARLMALHGISRDQIRVLERADVEPN